MGTFQRDFANTFGQPSFAYTDDDGDTVKAWRPNPGTYSGHEGGRGIRISSTSVHVAHADLQRFMEELERIAPKPCATCGGSGVE